jgi:hypothetical protein
MTDTPHPLATTIHLDPLYREIAVVRHATQQFIRVDLDQPYKAIRAPCCYLHLLNASGEAKRRKRSKSRASRLIVGGLGSDLRCPPSRVSGRRLIRRRVGFQPPLSSRCFMHLSSIPLLRSKTAHIPSYSDDTQQLILLVFAPCHGGRLVRAHIEYGQGTVPARRDQVLLVREPEEIGDEVIVVSVRPYFGLV